MYYPHRPGAVLRILGRSVVYPLVRFGWHAANALIGRFGNKMVVVAKRRQLDRESQSPSATSPVHSTTWALASRRKYRGHLDP
jgi:hypothetical protein